MARGRRPRRTRHGARRTQSRRSFPLRAIARSFLGLFLTGMAFWGLVYLSDPQTLPVRKVRIEGQFKHVTKQRLREAVAAHVTGGFFSVDLEAVRAAAEDLPWVAQVRVRRIWPDGLQIQVKEQEPLARWGKDALVSLQAEVFTPARESFPEELPELQGPPGSERLLVARFEEVQAQLKLLGLQVSQLTMGERRDWHVVFSDGMELVLGRARSEQRLARFRQIYARLLQLHREDIRLVDMRYTNGFAVAWRGGKAPAWVREAAFDV